MTKFIKGFARNEDGATMVEYGIMVALIAAICILTITSVGSKVLAAFTTIDNAMP